MEFPSFCLKNQIGKSLHQLQIFTIVKTFITLFYKGYCRNPSFGLVTKARGCKVAGQEGSSTVMSHVPSSAKVYEGIDPHTPKETPTLELESRWTLECLESDCKGQNPMD